MKNLQPGDARNIKVQWQPQGQTFQRLGPHRSPQLGEGQRHSAKPRRRLELDHPAQSTGNQFGETGHPIGAGHRQLVATAITQQVQLQAFIAAQIQGRGKQGRTAADEATTALHHLSLQHQPLAADTADGGAPPSHHRVVEGMPTTEAIACHHQLRRRHLFSPAADQPPLPDRQVPPPGCAETPEGPGFAPPIRPDRAGAAGLPACRNH